MKSAHPGRKKVTLRTRINRLVLLDILIVLMLVLAVFSIFVVRSHFNEAGRRALSVAKVVASMPEIIEGLDERDPSFYIQPITERVRRETGANYIYVASMSLVNYSSPDREDIGQILRGDNYQRVLLGETSVSQFESPIGLTVRAKAPIIGHDHGQRGIVAVSFLVTDVWNETIYYLTIIGLIGLVGLAVGFAGAHLLSGHVKKQIFDLEPMEIAFLSQRQGAILESIREAVVAVDMNGRINTCNQAAKRLLELDPSDDIIGKPVTEVIPNTRLLEVLASGNTDLDQPMVMGNTLVVANRIPVLHNGQVIGAVSTFRDKMQLDQVDQRLAFVGHYVDDLRSQRHEFMNRLHTIAGLIKIKDYDSAAQIIDQVNLEQQRVLDFFLARIRESAVVGILLGKLHNAKERGVQLKVDPKSRMTEQCANRELVVTVLGNAIENSIEALSELQPMDLRDPFVTVYINDEGENLVIWVQDNGPGIKPEIQDRILKEEVSTKGENRGFGLSLLSRRIKMANGSIKIESSESGTILYVELPKQEAENE